MAAPVTRFDRRLQRTSVTQHVLDTVTTFPIDAVITWVNAATGAGAALVSRYHEPAALDPERYVALDELRYCLRSIDM